MRWLFSFLLLLVAINLYAKDLPLQQIKAPAGFHLQIYAQNIPSARQMAVAPDGTVFVGTRRDKVYALVPDKKNFSHAREVLIIADGLNAPNGVAFYQGDLYIAEINRIIKYPDILRHLQHPGKPQLVAKLPDKRWHGYRYIKFGPDGWLYMGIGAPCNACISRNPLFATIIRMKPDGKDLQIYAKGVRNSVGFAWNPATNDLWFTDNGRDWLGDDLPPDELNRAHKAGLDFGFPYVYGNNVPDPVFGRRLRKERDFTPTEWDLPAHVAALGMIFYTGKQFPEKYHGQIFIAEHGSWNRSRKIGYRVSLVTLKDGKAVSYQAFITGWLQGEAYWGRPVDLAVLPDGSVLISDDYAGVIYRLFFKSR